MGVLAHVDAGKTTLSEAMLYKCGAIKKQGRVDHKDSFLDTGRLERERGITIFSKQAVFSMGDLRVSLLDTPGHMDFSSEMERTLSVLDAALLVISGPSGVQAHTFTLWKLLAKHRVPTFIWVNKMDLEGAEKSEILADLQAHFGNVMDFGGEIDAEKLAESSEEATEEYLEKGSLKDESIIKLIASRRVFPCYFGSALKDVGVDQLLAGLKRFLPVPKAEPEFGAKVYKIARDNQGAKLSFLKITGGKLSVRDILGDDKVSQLRVYNGERYTAAESAESGSVVCALGLGGSYVGKGYGVEADAPSPCIKPVLSYKVVLQQGVDAAAAYAKLKQLSAEDPGLDITWDEKNGEIKLKLMGEIQTSVLKEIIYDRFGLAVDIAEGSISYLETIASPVEGCGHYEPLRHYAEVHLLLEPLPAGSGIIFESACSTDDLDLNWQRLVLTNLAEKEHLGVLTASPITDIKITLIAGRAHLKHTEGGDFRQAVYRAVRQGLMKAENVLLEPWYDFDLEVPGESIGRAISDLKALACDFSAPKPMGGNCGLQGRGPASTLQNYQPELLSYTHGRGRLSLRFAGYYPCHNAPQVIAEIAYDPNSDVENTADSVFCSHGAGVNVKWNVADRFMHVDSGLQISGESTWLSSPKASASTDFDDRALDAVLKKQFAGPKQPSVAPITYDYGLSAKSQQKSVKKQYLIVDGYNMLFAWEETQGLAKINFGAAREKLSDILEEYATFREIETVLVFDGYKVPGNAGTKTEKGKLKTVYTPQGKSADSYIEALAREMAKSYNVKVATSDALVQLAALRSGLIRVSAKELHQQITETKQQIRDIIN